MYSPAPYIVLGSVMTCMVWAADLAVITPCPQDTSKPDLITVTAQYQPVETCLPTLVEGTSTYSYSTYKYVSTVIPCAFETTTSSTVLVTDVSQWVTVTKYPETTKVVGQLPDGQNTYETIYKHGLAMYDELGPLAIPGWQGSGLCDECEKIADDGSQRQKIRMQECTRRENWQSCIEYDDIWISTYVPPVATTTHPVCATRSSVSVAGTYTFAFRQPGCTSIVTAPARTVTVSIGAKQYSTRVEPEKVYTVTQAPWYAHITKSCNGPTVFDFTTTVTKTITLLVPYGSQGPSTTKTYINPPYTGFPPPFNPPPGYSTGGSGAGNPAASNDPPGGINGGPRPTGTTPTAVLGPFVTITVTPVGSANGGYPSTITLATPSGTLPGTIEVIAPPATSNPALSFTTGSFVTLNVTPIGPSDGSGPYTITIATPSGTAPGTVEVVNPPMGSATASSTSNTGQYVTIIVQPSGSGVSGSPVTSTIAQPSGTSPGTVVISNVPLPTLTTITGISTTITASLTTITVQPSGTNSGSVITSAIPITSAPSGTPSSNNPGAGSSNILGPTTVTCVGILCASLGISAPNAGATVTAVIGESNGVATTTAGPTTVTCVGILCASLGISVSDVGATVTAVIGGPNTVATNTAGPTTVTCVGILCASLGISAPNAGATVTAVIGGTNGAATTTAGPTTVTCVGLLCASLGISAPNAGATVTAVIGGTNGVATTTAGPTTVTCVGILCASLGISAPNAGATVTAVIGGTNGAATTTAGPTTVTCVGILCASLGISAPNAGATVTAVVGGTTGPASGVTGSTTITCTGLLCASLGISAPAAGATVTAVVANGVDLANIAAITATTNPAGIVILLAASQTGTTPCSGLLCVSASVSLPVGQASVSGVILPTAATTGPAAGGASAASSNGAATTSCVGALCVVASVSVPSVQVGASAVVLPTSNGAGNSAATTPAAAGATPATSCSGVLCVNGAVSVPSVQATVSAVVLPSNGVVIASVIVSTPATSASPSSAAAAPQSSNGVAAPCVGVLCASVAASVPVVQATVSAVVLPSSSILVISANVASANAVITPLIAPSSGVLQVSVSAVLSLVKRSGTPLHPDAVPDETSEHLSSFSVGVSGSTDGLSAIHPTTLRTTTKSMPTTVGYSDTQTESCFATLRICSDISLHSLFTTQSIISQSRIGRKSLNTVEGILERCLKNENCMTYGSTGDGSLGFTSTESINIIKDRLSDNVATKEQMCRSHIVVNLYSNSDHCLVRRLISEALDAKQ